MNQNTVSGDIIAFNLKQLGATDIKVFDSRMHIANFDSKILIIKSLRFRP